jgi:lipid-binding SYLF domain-containing protein
MRRICRGTAVAFALAWLTGFAIIAAPQRTEAGEAAAIEAAVDETLREFFWQVRGGKELVGKAAGVLVFPKVYKAGFGVGGEYGEGALRRRGKTEDYYNTISASFGFQLGAQTRSVIIAFMTLDALYAFQRVDGWKVGVDGSVAILSVGLGASIDTTRIVNPITAFIFDGKGLMYNLTLEGSKMTRITPR